MNDKIERWGDETVLICGYVERDTPLKITMNNTNKEARWKGAGMGDYYCSLCCEVGDIRSLRCPKCNARMYTNEEYNEKAKEWEAEDEAERMFWNLEGIV